MPAEELRAGVRILLTGASGGIGAATARAVAGPGTELALHYHAHRAPVEALALELGRTGCPTFLAGADLGDPAAVDRLAELVRERWDGLEALVLNAGNYPRVRFEEMPEGELERCLAVNLTGPARLVRRLLPLLRSPPSARIVAVSSILAYTGSTHGAHYAAAKAGLVGLARSLARELGPSITVNVVAPGPIDTAILAGDTPAAREARGAALPAGRVGRPQEVAAAIGYLLSPAAAFVTGTTIHVNGGSYLG